MDPFVRHFIRSSLVWLGVGVLLGLWMTLEARAVAYRPAHMHANLLGFVSMMIFGVAYHVLPRFTGNALRSRRAATLHLWLANGGLALMVAAWLLRVHIVGMTWLLAVGAVSTSVGAFLFIGNIWLTLGTPAGRPVMMRPPMAAPRP
jgi:heme/copper-type cytochrome/quinol oxidase subunit 1